jgi:hypothetical protein
MDRVGDEHAGFSFGYDTAQDIFEVIAWGFWNADMAIAFGVKIPAALRQRIGSKRLALDMSGLKPMREEGQQSCANLFRALSELGVTSTTVVTTSHLTKLQLVRLATESGAVEVQWLSGNAEHTRNA